MIPQSIRVYSEKSHGHTAFFRNRMLLETLFARLEKMPQDTFKVLFHACSIGAEPCSFVIAGRQHGSKRFLCRATDCDADFLRHAKSGVYPAEILYGMTGEERRYFQRINSEEVALGPEIRDQIDYLKPADFRTFQPDDIYDVVFLLNALLYVDAPTQARTIDRIASYNTGYLVTTAFHMQTIKDDLQRNGYEPVTENIEAIHNGWTGRRKLRPGLMVPGVTFTTPALEPFAPIEDYEWKYCGLFRKRDAAV